MLAVTVMVIDETTAGGPTAPFPLRLVSRTMSARVLISERVRQEVEMHNEELPETFHGLVQPEGAEAILGGFRMRTKRLINAERQVEKAVRAFEQNGFVLLVDDRQVESLDETVVLSEDSLVTFLRLVPLVGG